MDKPTIIYTPLSATPEAEISALANVYRFILDSAQKRGRLLDKSGPDGKERSVDDSTARTIIQE